MKLAIWNCAGALRNKLDSLESLDADVYIIQECEDPERSTKAYHDWCGNYLWCGSDKNKGIGIFTKKGHQIYRIPAGQPFSVSGLHSASHEAQWSFEDLELFLPFTLNDKYRIHAAWTKGERNDPFSYIGQLWKYIQVQRDELALPNTMIVGDLNSNVIWDKPGRWWNHSDVMQELGEQGIRSLYHEQTGEIPGKESTPTFYLQRNTEKPYHIDYALLSSDLMSKARLSIGTPADWLSTSDHMPILLKIHD